MMDKNAELECFEQPPLRQWGTTGKLDREIEQLNTKDRYNEYIMTGLRKQEGVSLVYVQKPSEKRYAAYLEEQASRHLARRHLFWDGDH